MYSTIQADMELNSSTVIKNHWLYNEMWTKIISYTLLYRYSSQIFGNSDYNESTHSISIKRHCRSTDRAGPCSAGGRRGRISPSFCPSWSSFLGPWSCSRFLPPAAWLWDLVAPESGLRNYTAETERKTILVLKTEKKVDIFRKQDITLCTRLHSKY